MQCRSHAAQLGRLYPEFERENYQVLLILGEPIEKAKHYAEKFQLPFPILADPERNIYHLYGLDKVLMVQRTASVIIDCNGIIQYMKNTTSPMVWLKESQEVLKFVKSVPASC